LRGDRAREYSGGAGGEASVTVPVHIVCGFLGAGKTTTIRAQLEARRGERVAVIVNDFGEAGFDEAVLSESEPFRITSIPGGCVCCTAPEGFVDALAAVLEGDPDRLLIEPTGLARPQDLVDTIRRSPHRERVALAPVVVLVDPGRAAPGDAAGQALFGQQLEAADVIVANRTDLCSADDLARFEAWVADLWPAPLAVHRTSHGRVPLELFEWPGGGAGARSRTQAPGSAHAHAGHAHAGSSTAGFAARSWVWPPEIVFERSRLEAALEAARGGLARFKGVFRTREGVFRYDVAGGRLHEAASAHRRDSRADAIAPVAGEVLLAGLARALEGALLSPEEIEARRHAIELALPDGSSIVVDRARLLALPGGVADVSQLFPKRAGGAARIASLWGQLGLPARGSAVVCAADGFASDPIPIEALREGLLLHSLEGGPLPPAQGGPFRLLIPEGVAGTPASCANVKGVVRIVLRPEPGPSD
jgi:G3E family GTPase